MLSDKKQKDYQLLLTSRITKFRDEHGDLKCDKCGEYKDVSLYEWQKDRPSPRKTCKLCRSRVPKTEEQLKKKSKYKRKLYASRRDHYRMVWEKSKYGVHKGEFNYNHCAICGNLDRLHIDHCHKTGNVRGLLCSNCNIGIGNMQDNIDILKVAIEYLKNPPVLDRPHFQIKR